MSSQSSTSIGEFIICFPHWNVSSDEDRGLVSWLLLYLQHLEYCLDQNTLLLNKYVLNKQRNVYEGQGNRVVLPKTNLSHFFVWLVGLGFCELGVHLVVTGERIWHAMKETACNERNCC